MVGKDLNKCGQLKIQQMAFMLIAVTLFFVLVVMFVLVIKFAGLKELATENEEKNAMLLVAKLANSPEFSCENAFGSKTDCVDADKLMELAGDETYEDFWGVAEIQLRKIYLPAGNEPCAKENYPDCGIIEILKKDIKKLPASSAFVTMCRKELKNEVLADKCELGKLIVSAKDET